MDKNESAKERRRPLEIFEKIWGQALVAMSTAEEEASKVGARMAEAAGWNQDEVKRQVSILAERLSAQRRTLESTVEEGVKAALSRLKVPRREEIASIGSRLDAIARRVEALERSR